LERSSNGFTVGCGKSSTRVTMPADVAEWLQSLPEEYTIRRRRHIFTEWEDQAILASIGRARIDDICKKLKMGEGLIRKRYRELTEGKK
jgi:hypothetical protein